MVGERSEMVCMGLSVARGDEWWVQIVRCSLSYSKDALDSFISS